MIFRRWASFHPENQYILKVLEIVPGPVSDLGLYLHWPFCRRRCGYCHFYTEPRGELGEGAMVELAERLIAEARRYAEGYGRWGRPPVVKTVYFGGGTPSSMGEATFLSVMEGLRRTWGWDGEPPEEITIEVNPEDVHAGALEAWDAAGVGRISLGVQSFQPALLAVLQRTTPVEAVEGALERLRAHPWKRRPLINIDLILGIPTQTPQDLERDLARILQWSPDHVSLYGLSIDPGTALHRAVRRGRVRPLPLDDSETLWELADAWLEDHGWRNYEVSNYARAGAESRHNVRYWQLRPWLGLGPGASGTFPAVRDGVVVPLRRKNAPLARYRPERPEFWDSGENEWLSRADFFLDFLITGLRLARGIPFRTLDAVFQIDSRELLSPWLEDLDRRGALCVSETVLRLNRRGRFALDRLLLGAMDLVQTLPELAHGPPPRWPPPLE